MRVIRKLFGLSPSEKPEVSDDLLTWAVTLASVKTSDVEESTIEVHC